MCIVASCWPVITPSRSTQTPANGGVVPHWVCLRNYLFFIKLKSEQNIYNFFSSNCQFLSSKNDPKKIKNSKKNSVQYFEMRLRFLTPKFREIQLWEHRNLRYTTSIFILLNIIPPDPVLSNNPTINTHHL